MPRRAGCQICYVRCLVSLPALPHYWGLSVLVRHKFGAWLLEHPFCLSFQTSPVVSNEFREDFTKGTSVFCPVPFSLLGKGSPLAFATSPQLSPRSLSGDFLQHFRDWLPWLVSPVAVRTSTFCPGTIRYIIRVSGNTPMLFDTLLLSEFADFNRRRMLLIDNGFINQGPPRLQSLQL
jgi:hypothetical protein